MRSDNNAEHKELNGAEAGANPDASLFDRQLLTYSQAARYLGISAAYLKKLKARGAVPYVQIGDLVRFRVASLDRWIQRKEVS